jgi:hypothetical protein
MNWWWTGIDRAAGGVPDRCIREVIATAGAETFPGAMAFSESGLRAVEAVCTQAASGATNKKHPS